MKSTSWNCANYASCSGGDDHGCANLSNVTSAVTSSSTFGGCRTCSEIPVTSLTCVTHVTCSRISFAISATSAISLNCSSFAIGSVIYSFSLICSAFVICSFSAICCWIYSAFVTCSSTSFASVTCSAKHSGAKLYCTTHYVSDCCDKVD